ncbi:DNA-binding protein [Pseudonocardia sp.]|uniref:DNA-binding protein n=1 Tax=Pseudonocardia sp. TaxID=60912 RepID=UPI00260501FB|nr:DNA-binding protein [Pseudonocardia sp.]
MSRRREMLPVEAVQEYSGYTRDIIKGAYKRGELRGERPSGFERGRVYFDRAEVDRWLASLTESA